MNDQKGKTPRPIRTSFVAGLLLGVIATILLPRFVSPLLPRGLGGAREVLQGVVSAKRLEPNRLLLTLPTAKGTILATFTEEVVEIDLLVQEGDSVTLEMQEYTPFADNPKIARVSKAPPPGSVESSPMTTGPVAPAEPLPLDTAEERADTSET